MNKKEILDNIKEGARGLQILSIEYVEKDGSNEGDRLVEPYSMRDVDTEKEALFAFDLVKDQAKVEDPMEVFDTALKNAGPTMEVRSRRVGGANYQVPREVRPERRTYLAMNWIIDAAKARKGKPMAEKLSEEIIAASKNEGEAIKKRENVHKMAESNKAFAHFAW